MNNKKAIVILEVLCVADLRKKETISFLSHSLTQKVFFLLCILCEAVFPLLAFSLLLCWTKKRIVDAFLCYLYDCILIGCLEKFNNISLRISSFWFPCIIVALHKMEHWAVWFCSHLVLPLSTFTVHFWLSGLENQDIIYHHIPVLPLLLITIHFPMQFPKH